MKFFAGAWRVAISLLLGSRALAAPFVGEQFLTDPVTGNRFVQATAGTESTFTYSAANQSLTAVLDVDYDAAYYLSAPFAALTDQNDASFSLNFRITALDTRVLPTAFIGLLTTNHVALGGDGLSMALSSLSNGLLAFSATVDHGLASAGGEAFALAAGVDYLAIGRYEPGNREFAVEVFRGVGFAESVGRSVAHATNAAGFSVDRVGLQNSGGTAFDFTNGSITVVIDNLFVPARPPVNLSISTNVVVDEGNSGTTNAVFAVSLSSPSVQTVRVDYVTEELSAVAGADFLAQSGTLVFPPGTNVLTLAVPVVGNRVAQPDRTFRVVLTNAVNGTLVMPAGVGTIRDDDVCVVSVNDAVVTEPAAGSADAVFTVSLSLSNSRVVGVRFATAGLTATGGSDFVETNLWITFPPGVTSQTCVVAALADGLDEPEESFTAGLSEMTNAVPGRDMGVGTILNSSPSPAVFLDASANVVEGGAVVATIHLAPASGRTVTVGYATSNGTASAGSDYVATMGTVTFSPGQTTATVVIATLADGVHEGTETFFLELTAATNAVPGNRRETISILNDDPVPAIDITDAGVMEGNAGTTNAVFVVSLSNPTDETVTVNFAATNGTALAGSDYLATNGVLTWLPGTTNAQAIVVAVIGDLVNEADETFSVVLGTPVHAALAKSQALCTISNDDFVSVSIGDAQVVEGDGGSTNLVFVVSLSGPSAQQVTVRYATLDGTATGGIDYATNSGVLTFSTNTTQTITVGVLGDVTDEPDETFLVVLTDAQNATLLRGTGVGTIIDDDSPAISIGDVAMSEGDSNTTVFTFPLTLSSSSPATVTVNFSTSNGTAVAGSDYIATNGVVTFPPGVVSANLQVLVRGDTLFESNEIFFVNLDSSSHATLASTRALATILNDDAPPAVILENLAVLEGTCTNVHVTLAYTSSIPVAVRFCVTTLPTNVFLICDTNCAVIVPTNVPPPCQVRCCELIIPPGALTASFRLCVEQNGVDETNPVGIAEVDLLGGPGQHGTNLIEVVNVDPPSLLGANAQVVEGDSGLANLCFMLRLSRPRDTNVSVDFLTLDGTALEGYDYLARTGTVVFTPGVMTQFVCIPVIGDLVYEGDETVHLLLTNAVNVGLPVGLFQGLILNDDAPPRLWISDASVVEGDAGVRTALFTVTVLSPVGVAIDVAYLVNDVTATGGFDYIRDSGSLHFEPGVSQLTIPVTVLGDTLDEPDETFIVQLLNPVNATFGRREAIGTILDDDPPEIRVSNPDVLEGNDGATNLLMFAITLSSTSTAPVSVEYFTRDGTATAGADYIATQGTVIFQPGQTGAVVVVRVIGETLPELNETLFLSLTNQVGGTVPGPEGIGTILDDDAPCISVASVVVQEQPGAPANAVFRITLDRPSTLEVSASYSTSNGTALAGSDYIAQSGTVIFSSGVTVQSVAIVVNDDFLLEPNETFYLHVFNPIHAFVCDTPGIGTIVDGSSLTIVSVGDAMVVEGDSGITNAVFPVTLSRPSDQLVSIDFGTFDWTATAGVDYLPQAGTVVFLPGMVSNYFTVPVIGDCNLEPDELILVLLSNPIHALLATGHAVGTILNDDSPPVVFAEGVTVREGDSGTTNAVFRLRLSCASSLPVSLHYATLDGTARAGSDYIATNGTVLFPAGATNAAVTVLVNGDLEVEPDEIFHLVLSGPDMALLANAQATGLILDDDSGRLPDGTFPCLSISDTSVQDDGSGYQTAIFAVTLSSPSPVPVCVQYSTTNGTAIAGPDYIAIEGVLCFPPGTTQGQIVVQILPNTRDETNEFFYVVFSNPTNATLCKGIAAATIINPFVTNVPPSVVLTAVAPCLTLPANLTLTATATDPDGRISWIEFFDHTNLLGVQWEAPFQFNWLDVPAGEHLLTAIAVDNVGARATSAPVAFSASFLPSLSIDDRTVVEGDTGITEALFTLSLSSASCHTVTVDVATFDGTAWAGFDYFAAQTHFIFLPGETQKTISVAVLGDTQVEPDETFYVCLLNVTHATLTNPCGLGTILNDDTNKAPSVTLAAVAPCLTLPTGLTLSATPTDPDGFISRVEFLDHTTNLLGVSLTAPFQFNWLDVPAGEHLLTAVAVDNFGARATSAPVAFSASFLPSLSIDDRTVVEGDAGITEALFTLSLSSASCHTVTVDVATFDGTARAGADYFAIQTSFTFLPGQTQMTVAVPVLGDTEVEPDETFLICLTNVTHATLVRPCGLGTILNDDTNAPPDISLAAVAPCLTLPTNLTLFATATDPDGPISRIEFFNHTNLLGVALTAPFKFIWLDVPAGQHLLTAVAVDKLGARATSAPVTFSASFLPSLSIDDRTVVEGDTGITEALFTLSLSSASCHTVTVDVATSDGTARAGADYFAIQNSFTFLPGQTQMTVAVPVLGDTEVEPDETFFVCLTNVTHATLVRPCGLGTILNDDTNAPPDISLAAVAPCLTLPTNLTLFATATDPDGPISRIEFFNHTNLLGVALSAPFKFIWLDVPAGEHLLTAVAVDKLGARATSAPVVFSASFLPSLSIDDRTVVEGDTGITEALFTLSLSSASCHTVTVDVATFDGTAWAGFDYFAAQTHFIFLPGETQKTISVAVLGDTQVEPDETFYVCLLNVTHATLASPCGLGTILNDDTNKAPSVTLAAVAPCLTLPTGLTLSATPTDPDGFISRVEFLDHTTNLLGVSLTAPFQFIWLDVPAGEHLLTAVAVDNFGARATSAPVAFSASFLPSLSIDDRTVVEGDTGITEALFTLSLSSASCHTVTVDVATFDGTAWAGFDYFAAQTHFIFLPGETQKTISVAVLGDTQVEPDETFYVCLLNVTHATLASPCGLGTILNDDTNKAPSVTLAAVAPCLTLPTGLTLSATPTDPDGFISRVEFLDHTTNLLGVSLTAPFQFIWLDVPAGEHLLTAVAVDNFGARATSAPVAFSASFLPSLSIDDRTVVEGDAGITEALFTLSLSSASCHTVTVDVATFDGTAWAGFDYFAAQTHFIFLPGETQKTISVAVLGDTQVEPDETFYVCLLNVTHATLANPCGLGTILNDDTNKAPSVTLAAVAPCLTLPTGLTLSATPTDPDGFISRVEFLDHTTNLLGVSLTAPFQFNWLDVPAGEHLLTAVAVDNFGARATSAPVAFSASFLPSLSIDDRTVVEGDTGITEALFTLSLSSASCHTVTVDVATFDGTAWAGFDYFAAQTHFIFLPGETQKTISVAVLGDTQVEPDETFYVCLLNVTHATLTNPCGLGTILNDDTNKAPSVTLAAVAPCLTLPTGLTLSATPTDPDGFISRVEFLDHTTNLLGVSLTAPFQFIWLDVPAGEHLLTAVAVDNFGARATSAPVAFSASFLPSLSIDDRTVVEGDTGITEALFTLSLSSASCHTVTVDVATFDGTAWAGFDYFAAQTHFIFLPGETQKTISVAVLGDTQVEPDETFYVCLLNVTHATLTNPCGLGTILNDDTNKAPSVTLAAVAPCLTLPTGLTLSATPTDPDGFISRVEFLDHTTNLLGVSLTTPFQFNWLDVPAGEHLLTAVAVDNFGARATSAPVAFSVSFLPSLSIDDRTVVEGDAGIIEALFTLSLSSASCHTVTVDVATFDGTAWAGFDYFAAQTHFIFLPGETQKTISVAVLGDTQVEPDETFYVCLLNVTHATLANPCGLGTILNDDAPCSTALTATPLPDQTRCVCDEVSFSTTVTSLEPVTFVWKHDGVVLPGETNNRLILQGLKPSQAGLYTVEIRSRCANTSRSATLTLHGAGNLNPVSFTNSTRIDILDHAVAAPYPSSLSVNCLPGPVKHLSVTLDGLSHSFPDDVDILLVNPAGMSLKLMSDAGGTASQKLTNVVLTFTDTATAALPDSTRIFPGTYRPTDYIAIDSFLPPAQQTNLASSFAPFIGTEPNGDWSLFVVDDQGGDAGAILRGWYLTIEWEDTVPLLTSPALLPDGRFAVTLHGLQHMTHVLEASSDMVNWTPVSTNTLAAPSILIFDPRPGREPHRFYRAVRCP